MPYYWCMGPCTHKTRKYQEDRAGITKAWPVSTVRGQHPIRSRDLRFFQAEAKIATVIVNSHYSLP
jgi:hypothetical protein